ncbi:MAG: alpha/beta hydrolase [Bacilli bacterium]|nr:alpha/beta hydrolase [Bacilli bacterium]
MILEWIIGRNIAKALGYRGDGAPQIRYFKGRDFGAENTSFSFLSGNNRLYGKRYFYGNGPYRGVMVFFHGIGAGHESYTQEICAMAKQGFLVYAYDNTGSMMSEGKGIGNLAQVGLDQQAFFAFLDQEPLAQGLSRYAFGHSWGGFAALLALQKQYHVVKVVSIAGFRSIPSIMEWASPAVKKLHRPLCRYLRRHYGEVGVVDATDLLNQAEAEVLYIQGEKDTTCLTAECLYHFQKHVTNPKVHFLEVKGRGHQPYWTDASCAYYEEVFQKRKMAAVDREAGYEIDYRRLNQDDPEIIKAIIDFFLR